MPTMRNYLVTIVDRKTGAHQKVIVQSPCACGMQERIDECVAEGHPDLTLDNPVVLDINSDTVQHLPLKT